jgi:hypothetical protein
LLNLLTAYKNEDNYTIWTVIRSIVCGLQSILLRTDLAKQFDKYALSVFRPIKEKVGWEPKPDDGKVGLV